MVDTYMHPDIYIAHTYIHNYVPNNIHTYIPYIPTGTHTTDTFTLTINISLLHYSNIPLCVNLTSNYVDIVIP